MLDALRELTRYRSLLYMMVWRDIRVRYKQSVMGFMWAVFMPVIIISAGILVKFAMAKLSGSPFTLSKLVTVCVKSLPWSFFVGSLHFSTNSLISNFSLVTKIYFPKEIFPISAVLSSLFDFAIASCVLILLLSIAQIGLSTYIFWVPVLLLLLILLAMALGMLFSAANLFFRDVRYIINAILSFGIFFTPVYYEADMFGRWSTLLLLNPLAPILEGFNNCLVLHKMPELHWILYSASFSLILMIFAYVFFKKLEPAFAENI